MQARSKALRVRLLFCLLMVLTLSCGSNEKLYGTYLADADASSKLGQTALELKENGAGVWRMGEDEVAFTWYVKGDQLRVHTKSGGVITGDFHDETISLDIPGMKAMSFKKVRRL